MLMLELILILWNYSTYDIQKKKLLGFLLGSTANIQHVDNNWHSIPVIFTDISQRGKKYVLKNLSDKSLYSLFCFFVLFMIWACMQHNSQSFACELHSVSNRHALWN